MGFQPVPTFAALLDIILKPFQHNFIELATEFAFCGICVFVDYERDVGVRLFVSIKEWNELCVDDDYLNFSMLENIGQILGFQSIIDS